jgi:hypothetical protein
MNMKLLNIIMDELHKERGPPCCPDKLHKDSLEIIARCYFLTGELIK